jgi:hypothetical protein
LGRNGYFALIPGRLVTLKSRTNNPVAQLLIECARELAKPLANKK